MDWGRRSLQSSLRRLRLAGPLLAGLLLAGVVLIGVGTGIAGETDRPAAMPDDVAPPLPSPITAPQSPWTWRLAGLLVAPGRRQALFVRAGESRTVSEGEDIDGWILVAVDLGSARLAGYGGERTLYPEGDPAVAAAAAVNARILAEVRERRQQAQRTELAMQALTKLMMVAAPTVAPETGTDPRARRIAP